MLSFENKLFKKIFDSEPAPATNEKPKTRGHREGTMEDMAMPEGGRSLEEYEKQLLFCRDELQGKTVLDLGAGPRLKFAKGIKERGVNADITSLSPDFSNIKYVQQARTSLPDAKLVAGIAQELPFKNQSFDRIFALHIWEHLNHDGFHEMISEVSRTLKTNGQATIGPMYDAYGGMRNGYPSNPYFPYEELQKNQALMQKLDNSGITVSQEFIPEDTILPPKAHAKDHVGNPKLAYNLVFKKNEKTDIGEKAWVYQHKGLTGGKDRPNSFDSVMKNYRGKVECDTFLLRDGNIAVIHERDFGMTREEIENLDLKELEALKITIGGDAEGTAIPLLTEFVSLAADADAALALEIRSSTVERSIELANRIIEQLRKMGIEGGFGSNWDYVEKKVNFQSFSIEVLKLIRDSAQDPSDFPSRTKRYKTTLFWPSDEKWAEVPGVFDWKSLRELDDRQDLDWHEKGLEIAARNNISEVEFQPYVLTPELIARGHKLGLAVSASLTNDEDMINKLVEMGVDSIKTEMDFRIKSRKSDRDPK